jgi:hypothetical protein
VGGSDNSKHDIPLSASSTRRPEGGIWRRSLRKDSDEKRAEPKENGQPTCCAPGDLSACVIQTTEERKKTHPEPSLEKEIREANETNKE